MNILVVDDDPDIVDIISYSLSKDGHRVIAGRDGQEALDLARKHNPDLAILDVMLPLLDGFEVCRRLRQESALPVILLTAKGEEADKIWGLDLGADDYVTKPFSHKELRARVRAVARRSASGLQRDQGLLEAGPIRMDLDQHEAFVGHDRVDLTPREFELLHCLLLNAGKVVTHEHLVTFVWGSNNLEADAESLKVHIRHLREKIERTPSAPEYILSVRGVGYKLWARAA